MSPEPAAPAPLRKLIDGLEGAEALDAPGKAIGKKARSTFSAGPVKDALSGTWLGHALHPMLTDVVIGSFMSASLLDLLGGDDESAQRLIGVGLAAYGPTAMTGVSDWSDTEIADARVRRVGLVHAATNATAFSLYAASLVARRRGATGRGKLLGLAGGAALGAGGLLGGHMSFAQGVGPNQTAFDPGPDDWSPAGDASDVVEGTPRAVVVDDTPVLLVRHGDGLHAIHDRCSHRGCSLSDGEFDGETVTCNCHGSTFDLRDGSVLRGPATVSQPSYDVRESGGRIEIRRPAAG